MNLVITNQGQKVLAELLTGKTKLQFSKVQLSDFDYVGVDLKTLTEIRNVRQETLISGVKIVGRNLVELVASVDNTALETGYYIKAIGIFAQLEDGSEFLFAVTTDEVPYYMPILKGKSNTAVVYKFNISVADTAVINVTVKPTATPTITQVEELEKNKVDKIPGKGLSTNDFTNSYKAKVDNLDTDIGKQLEGKVDKVLGKQLSTNDFTNFYKNKLDGMSSDIDAKIANKVDKIPGKGLSTNDFTNSYKAKVDSIDANVTTELVKLSDVQEDILHDFAALTFELKQKSYIEGGGIDNIIVDTLDSKDAVERKSGNYDTDKKMLYI